MRLALAVAAALFALQAHAQSVRSAQALLPGYAYPAGDTVRVATLNLEHFVDVHDSPYVRHPREDRPDTAQVAEKARLFADALRALDADVVSLQEVEGEAYVRALADSLFPDLGYRFFGSADDSDWYQNVVVMSRLPLGPLTTFADAVAPIPGEVTAEGTGDATDLANHRLFAVEVYARPHYALTLVAAHLKAGTTPRDVAWRTGQARLLHAWLAERARLEPALNVVVAGDLNATPGDLSYLELLNASGAVRLVDPLQSDPAALSHPSAAPTRRLDHVLLNEAAALALVPGSAGIRRPLRPGALERLSDHLPVALELVARDR